MKIFTLYFCYLLFIILALSGCKNKKEDEDIIVPALELYQKGFELLENKNYTKAANEFGQVFYQHPGDELTPKAELMQAYSYFREGDYDDAIEILNTFVKLHPMHQYVDYAYYLRALCYYMEISNINLDQSKTAFAKESFKEVINRFPNTKYAIDATLKIDLVNDHLAGKEMEIGRYYLSIKNPISALKRFQNVVNNYQTTSHIHEALYRMVESCKILGLNDEAKKYAALLGYNYPNSKWYKHSYDLIKDEN